MALSHIMYLTVFLGILSTYQPTKASDVTVGQCEINLGFQLETSTSDIYMSSNMTPIFEYLHNITSALQNQQKQLDNQQMILTNVSDSLEEIQQQVSQMLHRQQEGLNSLQRQEESLNILYRQEEEMKIQREQIESISSNLNQTMSNIFGEIETLRNETYNEYEALTSQLNENLNVTSTLVHQNKKDLSRHLSIATDILLCSLTRENSIRLVHNGDYGGHQGRVEVKCGDQWGSICDDEWDTNAAIVICRQLGLPYLQAEGKKNAYFGRGTGLIWMDDVYCTGFEVSLWECEHAPWGTHDCGHNEDAGVICK